MSVNVGIAIPACAGAGISNAALHAGKARNEREEYIARKLSGGWVQVNARAADIQGRRGKIRDRGDSGSIQKPVLLRDSNKRGVIVSAGMT